MVGMQEEFWGARVAALEEELNMFVVHGMEVQSRDMPYNRMSDALNKSLGW